MSAYVIFEVDVKDAAQYERYRAAAPATLEEFGGRYIARGGRTECLEGEWQPRRMVLLEFPSYDAARRWYDSPQYEDAKTIREGAAEAKIVLVDGM
jgi:uncharacterized protein (DUF1330 family)